LPEELSETSWFYKEGYWLNLNFISLFDTEKRSLRIFLQQLRFAYKFPGPYYHLSSKNYFVVRFFTIK